MQVISPLWLGFVLFDPDAMSIGVGILPNPSHLPGHFHARCAAGDLELVVGNLFRDVEHRRGSADGCEQVAKVFIQGAEPFRQPDNRFAVWVELHDSVVDIFHVWRLDKRVIEVPIPRIERMVYLERATALRERAVDLHVAIELCCWPKARAILAEASLSEYPVAAFMTGQAANSANSMHSRAAEAVGAVAAFGDQTDATHQLGAITACGVYANAANRKPTEAA